MNGVPLDTYEVTHESSSDEHQNRQEARLIGCESITSNNEISDKPISENCFLDSCQSGTYASS